MCDFDETPIIGCGVYLCNSDNFLVSVWCCDSLFLRQRTISSAIILLAGAQKKNEAMT